MYVSFTDFFFICLSIVSKCYLVDITLQSDGNKVDLINDKGIDDFVNLLESSQLSKNSQYYGDLHNAGHVSMRS